VEESLLLSKLGFNHLFDTLLAEDRFFRAKPLQDADLGTD
jgi:hypothetical protein